MVGDQGGLFPDPRGEQEELPLGESDQPPTVPPLDIGQDSMIFSFRTASRTSRAVGSTSRRFAW